VVAGRLLGDEEGLRDLHIRRRGRDEPRHLALARGQLTVQRVRAGGRDAARPATIPIQPMGRRTVSYARNATGDSIAFQVVGNGPRDIVFVPGFVSHLEVFWAEPSIAHFYERLASFSRLILFDKRGTGLSDPALAPLPLDERMEGVRALIDMWLQVDIRDVLPSISVPTLVLHRTEEYFPIEAARDIAARIPGARFVELPGVDHPPWFGDMEAYVAEIEEFVTGVREHAGTDRVLSTVLITDIVGSTERAAAIGDAAWRNLMARHDRLVREELERFRGREVKHTGDGFLATFDSPARGIRCARAIVESASAQLGIAIRAGLHTGEVEVVGSDLRGLAVHLAARVAAVAGPGEVVITSTVKELVLGSGLVFVERGPHELKGVPDEWRLFALAAEAAAVPHVVG
jgi:class 3 adenylate cyclase/pimeloyl-ACP methyl ester carboxylesterase